MIENLSKLRTLWNKQKNARAYVEESLRIYDGDWTDLIKDALSKRFHFSVFKELELEIDPSINLFRRVIVKHGSIYSNPAHRSIDGQELPQEYLQDGEFDRLIQEVSRLLLACRQLLIRPMVFSDGIDFDVITPDKFTVLPGTRRGKAEAIVYKIGEEFIYWDSKKQAKLSHSFKVLDETINPYGFVPLLPVFARKPLRGFWQIYDANPLRALAMRTAQAITDHNYLQKQTSSKKVVVNLTNNAKLETKEKQILDVGRPLIIKGQGSASTLDLTSDFAGLLTSIVDKAGLALAQFGFKAEFIRSGGYDSATSGYQLKLMMSGIEEQWQELRGQMRPTERSLYDLTRRIVEIERRREELEHIPSFVDGKFSIVFGQAGPDEDPNETKTYWHDRLAAGTTTLIEALMKMDGISKEEAELKAADIEAEKSLRIMGEIGTIGENEINVEEFTDSEEPEIIAPLEETDTPIPGGDV